MWVYFSKTIICLPFSIYYFALALLIIYIGLIWFANQSVLTSYGHNFQDTLEAYIMTRQFASYSPFNLEFLIIEAKRKLSHSWKANGITDLDCNFSCDMLPKNGIAEIVMFLTS